MNLMGMLSEQSEIDITSFTNLFGIFSCNHHYFENFTSLSLTELGIP